MDEKQKRFLSMLPRMILVMAVSIYVSGFVKSELDILWAIIGIIFLTAVLFFIPIKFEDGI